jgi:DNA polymerase I-like protein with 3'-5' exonuclease and polymerase domains
MGNYALEACLGHAGVTNWRGSVVDLDLGDGKVAQVMVTINPAYAMRERKMEPMFKMDCQRLERIINGTFKPHTIDGLINPTFKQAISFIHDLQLAAKPTAFDIEVINGETACYGLSNDAGYGICINLRDHASNRYSPFEEAEILTRLSKLFRFFKLKKIPTIMQNGMFDSYWVWLHDYLKVHCSHDTLLAHHTLYPQWPHNLGFLTSQYTTHPFYKDEGKQWREGGNIDDFWRYNIKDACILIPIHRKQVRELKEQGLDRFFNDHVMRLQPHCVAATVHGVAVDAEAKEEAIEVSARELKKHEEEVYHHIEASTGRSYSINLRSRPQLSSLLFKVLKLEGKGLSTDKANRERIKKNPKTPAVAKELLVAYDRFQTESTFHANFATSKLSDDGRFRAEFKQYGVVKAPGRLSSKQLLTGEGGNFQNQPPRARHMYVADDDCCFIYFDLRQAEAIVVAYRANIPSWKEQFDRMRRDGNYDAHRALASDMWKIPYDQIPRKDYEEVNGVLVPTLRYKAKRCRHGLNYRMEVEKLSEVTGLPYHEARTAYYLYHKLTPELRKWWAQAIKDFRENKACYNALGRRLKVIQRIDDNVLESVVAFYPQSTIGDKVSQVWYQSMEDPKWPRTCRIAVNVHDSLTGIAALTRKQDAYTALSIMKKYAEKPLMIQDAWHNKAEPVVIPAETKMSFVEKGERYHRWSNLKEVQL